jgi:hypothetical protein
VNAGGGERGLNGVSGETARGEKFRFLRRQKHLQVRQPAFRAFIPPWLSERVMRHYRIYSLDQTGRICLAEDFECANDREAEQEGKLHAEKHAIEVWERTRLVASIERKAA